MQNLSTFFDEYAVHGMLGRMAECHEYPLTPGDLAVMRETLSDLSVEPLMRACALWLDTEVPWFPTAAQLRALTLAMPPLPSCMDAQEEAKDTL